MQNQMKFSLKLKPKSPDRSNINDKINQMTECFSEGTTDLTFSTKTDATI
jgi:hypothetical protein